MKNKDNKYINKKNNEGTKPGIDEKSVRILARLLEETHLTEIEYQMKDQRIRVVRQGTPSFSPGGSTVVPFPPASSPGATPPVSVVPPVTQGEPVTSPMVGTVYLSAEPGASSFVRPGDSIKKGDTLLIIEAMKVMNPIRAPRDGKVIEVCVSDARPVEFGEVLLILE